MWTCLCIVRSSFKMHIHTLVHTCILPKLTQPVCRTPNHDYKLKCEELFFFFSFALFYTCKIFFSPLGFHKMMEHPEYFLSCHKLGLHTLPRGALVKERRPKHKLNQGFVPNCYMFSIWHLSKLLYMWGTFIVRDCLCVWAIIFNVCHSQRDGTVLHMLCNQAHSWSWIV